MRCVVSLMSQVNSLALGEKTLTETTTKEKDAEERA